MAEFSKLKRTETQEFSKLKQIFLETQAKNPETQFFGNYGCKMPLKNTLKSSFFSVFKLIFAQFSQTIPFIFENSKKFYKNSRNFPETQEFLASKLKEFAKTQFFGNSIPLHTLPLKRPKKLCDSKAFVNCKLFNMNSFFLSLVLITGHF